jgi:phosphoglycolate phosphatase
MRYNTVLFDLDGTLVDTKPGIIKSAELTFKEMNMALPPDEILSLFPGPPLFECFNEVCGLSEELSKKAVPIYRRILLESGNIFNCIVYDGITGLLEELKGSGVRLGVATSKRDHLAAMVLSHLGIADYFDAVCGALTDYPVCTKAESILRALSLIGGSVPQASVIVGDRMFDAHGAVQAGIDSIGVYYGYGSAQEIDSSPFTFTVTDVGGIGELLRSV